MSGLLFISYARVDLERVRPLVEYLDKAGIQVWWDRDLNHGDRFREKIQSAIHKASCVIVFWTQSSVNSTWVPAEISQPAERGALIPVVLDSDLDLSLIPLPYGELNHADLSQWQGNENHPELKKLLSSVSALCSRNTNIEGFGETLSNNDWLVNQSERATKDLVALVSKAGSLSNVLLANSEEARKVCDALSEVDKTYRAVVHAIVRFIKPGFSSDTIDAGPYLEFEHGLLESDIKAGRGSCLAITTLYVCVGGLRDWLESRLSQPELAELDAVFLVLGDADGDLFDQLAAIGVLLTNESRLIVNHLQAQQPELAKQRILQGREAFQPLEQLLRDARAQLEEQQLALGFKP